MVIQDEDLNLLENQSQTPEGDFLQSLAVEDLLRELVSTVCFCGATKQARQTFCRGHYFSLPTPMRQGLYNRMGQGYEQAYSAARRLFQAKAASQAGKVTLGALGLLLMFALLLVVFVMAMSANV